MLVVINPVSGRQKGLSMWRERCAPIVKAAGVEYEEIITDRPHHGTAIARGLDLAKYEAVVSVGGDGLLYELLEGFMSRPDWRQAVTMVLGVVPGGTGNGLAFSILHAHGEAMDCESMAFLIAKGQASSMDLCSVETSQARTYSFLSTEWALPSDIDITSEKYRCCGSFRFTCRALELLFCDGCVRKYPGSLHFLPVGTEEVEISDVQDGKEGGCLHDYSTLLPPLDTQIGEAEYKVGWQTITTDDWQYFWAMSHTHMAQDSYTSPNSKLDDGVLYVDMGRGIKCAPFKMLCWLLAMEEGKHVDSPHCDTQAVRAFRLEPGAGLVAVDGELVPTEPMQVQVHRGLLRVYA